MKKKIKILHIINGMGTGGAEADIMNWFRTINREEFSFDFLIRSNNRFYESEIKSLGGQLEQVSSFPRHMIRNVVETYQFLKRNNYDVIHIHGNTMFYVIPLLLAKKLRINTRIFHIHNTKANNFLSGIIHKVNSLCFSGLVTSRIACSKQSGQFGFGKRTFTVVNNGIDIKKYVDAEPIDLDPFNIDQKTTIILHVGRFLPVKNQDFVLKVFGEFYKNNPNSILLFVGDGELKEAIFEASKECEFSSRVFFLGERNDIPNILKTADLLVFPSKYEGVPLVVLEAQAAQLKVLMSDVINPDVILTPVVKTKSLNCSPSQWAMEVQKMLKHDYEYDVLDSFYKRGYSIEQAIDVLCSIYRQEAQ